MARPSKIAVEDLRVRLMADGPSSAADLAARLRVDRSTITRNLADIGGGLVSLGATRRTRYALRRQIRDAGSEFPLYRIDPAGRAQAWGTLEAFHGAWRMTWAGDAPAWTEHFADREGVWQGFPFFLGDIRPQGFLGRAILRRMARTYRLPDDLRRWDDDDTLVFLAGCGEDLPGDLVVGEDCLRRALALQLAPPDTENFPALAAQAANDPPPGSSAGGEQPKFLATLADGDGRRPVLVKFSPPMVQDTGRRWADLLAMEFHALAVLAGAGLAETGHRLIDQGGRRFLEAPRFDRTLAGGRTGVVSLEALHSAAMGRHPGAWSEQVLELERIGLVDPTAVRDTRRLQAFGELIGNTDRHAGNLAFRMTDALPFALTPAYDMLPMLWAPGPQGELVERTFVPLPPVPGAAADAWREMLPLAIDFWARVADDSRVAAESASRARDVGTLLERMGRRFG